MELKKMPVILSFEKDEHVPIFLSYSHNLKNKNLAFYDSQLVYRSDSHSIIKREGVINDKKITIIYTFYYVNGYEEFLRGFLYVNDKEYLISSVTAYASLQIEECCYDNITLVKIPDETFEI
jgi:hypothetical protein